MPLTNSPKYIHEPTPLQCGQAVLAMLGGTTVEEIIKIVSTEKETTLRQMFAALDALGIDYGKEKKPADTKADLPEICFLSLETPKCWHWSLFYKGKFFDPEYGILDDFPPSNRKYFFEIKNN